MKSFVDFLAEDKEPKEDKEEKKTENKEEKDSKQEDSNKKSSFDPADYSMKLIYGEDDYAKKKKQMHATATFGSKYEVTYKTVSENQPTNWKVSFTKGFDGLKEKDKSKIENCLDALSQTLYGFTGGELTWDRDPQVIFIEFRRIDKDVKEIAKSWFEKNRLSIESDYKKEISTAGTMLSVVCIHKKFGKS